MKLARNFLCETSADLASIDPLTLRSRRAAHTQNEPAHVVLGSLAQNEPTHNELLPMDGLALEPIGRAA